MISSRLLSWRRQVLTIVRFQVFNSSSDSGGLLFTTSSSNGRAALSVDANSAEGDVVNTSDILTTNQDEVGYLWSIRSEEAVDTAAYPATFVRTYDASPLSVNWLMFMTDTHFWHDSSRLAQCNCVRLAYQYGAIRRHPDHSDDDHAECFGRCECCHRLLGQRIADHRCSRISDFSARAADGLKCILYWSLSESSTPGSDILCGPGINHVRRRAMEVTIGDEVDEL